MAGTFPQRHAYGLQEEGLAGGADAAGTHAAWIQAEDRKALEAAQAAHAAASAQAQALREQADALADKVASARSCLLWLFKSCAETFMHVPGSRVALCAVISGFEFRRCKIDHMRGSNGHPSHKRHVWLGCAE
jgi:hypothetical protein